MAQEYKNKGPVYITSAKYEAARAAGTLETGREYRITDWEAQEKLIAGNNITIAADGKTISSSCVTQSEMSTAIANSKILTDTETGTQYQLKVTNGVLSIEAV